MAGWQVLNYRFPGGSFFYYKLKLKQLTFCINNKN